MVAYLMNPSCKLGLFSQNLRIARQGPMDPFLSVFDAVVPPLATAAAIGTYAGSLLDTASWRKNGVGAMSHVPLLMLCASSSSWLIYGLMTGIMSMIVSNSVGLLISLYLVAVFNTNSAPPFARDFVTHSSLIVCYTTLLALFASATGRADVVGTIASVMAIVMFASPLATLRVVIETQSADSLPAPMIIIGLICTTLWTLYGIRLDNVFMYGPNGIAFVLGLIQVALLLRYPKKGSALPV